MPLTYTTVATSSKLTPLVKRGLNPHMINVTQFCRWEMCRLSVPCELVYIKLSTLFNLRDPHFSNCWSFREKCECTKFEREIKWLIHHRHSLIMLATRFVAGRVMTAWSWWLILLVWNWTKYFWSYGSAHMRRDHITYVNWLRTTITTAIERAAW